MRAAAGWSLLLLLPACIPYPAPCIAAEGRTWIGYGGPGGTHVYPDKAPTEFDQTTGEGVLWETPLKVKYDARALLILLYAYPNDVKSSQVPFVDTWAETEKARFIKALVHDRSAKIGDIVRQVLLDHPKDDYLGPACLRCLASRGYAAFLVAQLGTIDYAQIRPTYLHLQQIEAISTSQEELVQQQLLKILKTTRNDAYFMAALAGAARPDRDMVLELAKKILGGLSEDTDQARSLL